MATTPSVVTGRAPVPFKDFAAVGNWEATQHDDPLVLKEYAAAASALPINPKLQWLRCYQGTSWVPEAWVPGIMAIQRGGFFTPRHDDVVLASPPKSGTTWLKALAFATMARGEHPPAGHPEHPLLRLNPHDCVPFMERLFATRWGSKAMEALPSPRVVATHMHHSILPASISENPHCKIVYICREPKDMLVSMWHFARKVRPYLRFADLFEAACEGTCLSGPFWDHVLGYWNASKASPETVLFLRYEEMLRSPVSNVIKLARFLGRPFSPAEEEAGVAMDVVRLCSFEKLKDLDVNRIDPGSSSSSSLQVQAGVEPDVAFRNDSYFRRGVVGDWANHMTPEMARRLDKAIEDRLHGSGLSFA